MSTAGYDLCQIPSRPPPAGVTPNFVDPPTLENLPKIFTYVTLPLMVIALVLRCHTRIFVTRNMGWDDYLCVMAAITIIVQIITTFMILGNPAGPHMWDVPACKITPLYAKIGTLQALMFPISATFIKTSILALYKRIFGHVKLASALILSGIGFISFFYTIMFIFMLATGLPYPNEYATGGWMSPSYWTRAQKFSSPSSATIGIVGAIVDLYILIVPLFFIWKLRTSTKRKAGVSSVFIAGSAATIFSIVGAVFRFQITTVADQDITWNGMLIYAMNISEINLGIMCSCMPIVFALFNGLLERSASWLSGIISRTTGRSRKASNMSPSDGSDVPGNPYKGRDERGQKLPDIPKGTVTGLRSFVRNIGRGNHEQPQTGISTDQVLLTVVSEDYDYHQQLREGRPWTGNSANQASTQNEHQN